MTVSLDVANLQRLYAAGETDPETIIRDVYARIRSKGVLPDWITLVDQDTAITKAATAPRGPLYGIPFAVKDNIDVAGLPTTCACPEFSSVAARSATVVERLEAAGAVLIGKTNLDQFATGLNGTRSPYGIPSSAFNPDYIAGGSSSGSAVAVAAGLVSFALGTDTAGSGRVPAAFNNLVGLKPTKGTISMRGVVPACRTQDTVSIFALTVGDACKVAATAIAFDEEDAYARRDAPAFSVKSFGRQPKIGVPSTPIAFFGDRDYEALYRRAVERCETLGAEIIPIDFSAFEQAAAMLYAGPWVAERLLAAADLADRNPEAIHEVVRGIILSARGKTAAQSFQAFYALAELTRQAESEWAKMDVLLLPTAPTTFTIKDMLANPVTLNSQLGTFTNFVNLMDLAALAVPAGFRADNIPFGVTLIGPALSDGMLAAVGDRLHRSLEDAPLGAMRATLSSTPLLSVAPRSQPSIQLAVVGAHLSGQPLNVQLTERDAKHIETTRTATGYRLFALADTSPPKPGLVFDCAGAGGIEVEVWEIEEDAFGSFVALIPAPLCLGSVQLADGRTVKGFLCETYATVDAEEITDFGGWRAWLGARGPR